MLMICIVVLMSACMASFVMFGSVVRSDAQAVQADAIAQAMAQEHQAALRACAASAPGCSGGHLPINTEPYRHPSLQNAPLLTTAQIFSGFDPASGGVVITLLKTPSGQLNSGALWGQVSTRLMMNNNRRSGYGYFDDGTNTVVSGAGPGTLVLPNTVGGIPLEKQMPLIAEPLPKS
jgi:hypothetical protein